MHIYAGTRSPHDAFYLQSRLSIPLQRYLFKSALDAEQDAEQALAQRCSIDVSPPPMVTPVQVRCWVYASCNLVGNIFKRNALYSISRLETTFTKIEKIEKIKKIKKIKR